MPSRRQRRRGYDSKKVRAGIEQSILRARMQNFTVREIEVCYDAFLMLCKEYGNDELEEVLGVPLVVGDTDDPYHFGIVTDTPEHMNDPIEEMRQAIE